MIKEKKFYVYIHRRKTDGSVFYVGKGSGNRAIAKKGRNPYWKRVDIKYGRTVHIVMRFENEQCAFSFECALIKFYGRENLCNLTDGGEGICNPSLETRSKKSKAVSGDKHPFWGLFGKDHPKYGKPVSNESRAKMSKSSTGVICKPETREKLRRANIGKSTSKETIEKLRQSGCKPIKTKCGMEFYSVRYATRWLSENGKQKAQVGPIIHCCKNERGYKSAYGYIWEYKS